MNAGRTRLRAAAAACALLAILPAGASAAAAATAEPSNWWYDVYDVGAAQAAGWTGEGVKVAVIDQLINPDLPVFAGQNLAIADPALCAGESPTSADPSFGAIHGSTVTAVINGNGSGPGSIRGIAPGADVTFYGYGDDGGAADGNCTLSEYPDQLTGFGLGVQRAIDDGARIITTSVVGGFRPDDAEVVANALAKGVIVISSTTNPSASSIVPLTDDAQILLNGVVAATAVDRQGDLQTTVDGEAYVTPATTVVAAGTDMPTIGVPDQSWDASSSATGSSLAAPLVAGMLAVAAQRYPDATANQLLQSLLHTTGGEQHDLEHDATSGYGYGAAWLTSLLAVDPAQYPDENPLMDKGEAPTAEQVTAAGERGSTYPLAAPDSFGEYDDDASAAPQTGNPLQPVLIAGLVVLGVVIVGGIVTIVIVVSRKKKTPQGGAA